MMPMGTQPLYEPKGYAEAKQLFANGDPIQALAYLQAALSRNPFHAPSYHLKASIHLDEKKYLKAAEALRQCLVSDREFIPGQFLMGLLNCRLHQNKEAGKAFTEALRLTKLLEDNAVIPYSDGLTAMNMRYAILAEQRQLENGQTRPPHSTPQAIASHSPAIRINYNQITAKELLILGLTNTLEPPDYLKAQNYAFNNEQKKAILYLNKVIAADPFHAPSFYLQATIFFEQGNLTAASGALRKCIVSDRSFILAHVQMGFINLKLNNSYKAQKSFNTALKFMDNFLDDDFVPYSNSMIIADLEKIVKKQLSNRSGEATAKQIKPAVAAFKPQTKPLFNDLAGKKAGISLISPVEEAPSPAAKAYLNACSAIREANYQKAHQELNHCLLLNKKCIIAHFKNALLYQRSNNKFAAIQSLIVAKEFAAPLHEDILIPYSDGIPAKEMRAFIELHLQLIERDKRFK